MFKYLLCILFIVGLTTCSKIMCGCDEPPIEFFKATVVEVSDSYCNKPLLKFEDSVDFCTKSGLSRATCVANQLPDSLDIPGKKLNVTATLLQPNEDFPCSGTGTSYPHVKIYFASSRN